MRENNKDLYDDYARRAPRRHDNEDERVKSQRRKRRMFKKSSFKVLGTTCHTRLSNCAKVRVDHRVMEIRR